MVKSWVYKANEISKFYFPLCYLTFSTQYYQHWMIRTLKSWFLQFLTPNSFTILILEYSLVKQINNQESSLLEKCPYSELFWSVFSRIRTISPYSIRMRELLTSNLPQICDSKITSRVSSRMSLKGNKSCYKKLPKIPINTKRIIQR